MHLVPCLPDVLSHPGFRKKSSLIVTAKIEVLRKCAMLVVKWMVMAQEHQLDRLWREGLRPRALANLEGDSTQWELGLLAVGRGVAHRRAQGKENKPP